MKFEVEYTVKGFLKLTKDYKTICIVNIEEVASVNTFIYGVKLFLKNGGKDFNILLDNEEEVQTVVNTIYQAMAI